MILLLSVRTHSLTCGHVRSLEAKSSTLLPRPASMTRPPVDSCLSVGLYLVEFSVMRGYFGRITGLLSQPVTFERPSADGHATPHSGSMLPWGDVKHERPCAYIVAERIRRWVAGQRTALLRETQA